MDTSNTPPKKLLKILELNCFLVFHCDITRIHQVRSFVKKNFILNKNSTLSIKLLNKHSKHFHWKYQQNYTETNTALSSACSSSSNLTVISQVNDNL